MILTGWLLYMYELCDIGGVGAVTPIELSNNLTGPAKRQYHIHKQLYNCLNVSTSINV